MYLIPTIDVEAIRTLKHQGCFEDLILGKTGQGEWGVPKMLNILEKYQANATFFIDYAEAPTQLNKFRLLSTKIIERGFDIQLHVHPQFCADINRFLMCHYSIEEQIKIIKKCSNIYYQCCDRHPIAFRAGGYGADSNTFDALAKNGINIDTSYYPGHRWCNIKNKPANSIFSENTVTELPVTVFANEIHYKLMGFTIGRRRHPLKKLDLDHCNKEVMSVTLRAFKKANIRYVILFMHSFSLIKKNWNYKKILPDKDKLNRLKYTLEFAKYLGYEIVSVKDVADELLSIKKSADQKIPEVISEKSFIKATLHGIKGEIKNRARKIYLMI